MKKRIALTLIFALLLSLALPLSALAADYPAPKLSLSDPNGVYKIYKPESITISTEAIVSAGLKPLKGEAYYTTDGTDPTDKSTAYTSPVQINKTTTLKAIAYYAGAKSAITTMKYEYIDTTPKASPAGGTYKSEQSVTLTSPITGGTAKIYYTLDGTDPTASDTKVLYSGAISVKKTTTIKAAAYWDGKAVYAGSVMTETYAIGSAILPGGLKQLPPGATAADVTLGDDVAVQFGGGADEYMKKINDVVVDDVYVPGYFESNCIVSGNTLIIDSSAFQTAGTHKITIKADNYSDRTCNVVVKEKPAAEEVDAPTASPKGGSYDKAQTVTLTCGTADAAIYYTTDGKNPTTASTKYTGPISVSTNATLKAIAAKTGLADSSIMTESYSFSTLGEPPVLGDMKNFLIKNTYKRGQFTDVDETQWFGFDKQKVIASAFEYGLMKGDSPSTFNPSGNVTVAEAITMAARVHSIYMTGTENFAQGSPWYQVYVEYALKNGIIGENEFTNLTRAATRAEMAAIFTGALHSIEFMSKNTVKSIPDVDESDQYGLEIYMLYGAGVLTGSDSAGTFKPESNITRAEASAIISRVALPDSRASGRTFK